MNFAASRPLQSPAMQSCHPPNCLSASLQPLCKLPLLFLILALHVTLNGIDFNLPHFITDLGLQKENQ